MFSKKFAFAFASVVRAVFVAAASLGSPVAQAADITLLNVSYDPTRELYQNRNAAFARQYKVRMGVRQSHSGL